MQFRRELRQGPLDRGLLAAHRQRHPDDLTIGKAARARDLT